MNVLIATEPGDVHALAVKLALETKGHICTLWFSADMPTRQTNSISISNEGFHWFLQNERDQTQKIMSADFDVIWWRRARQPHIPEMGHKNDLDCIQKENNLFYRATPLILNPNAWWINPHESHQRANSKVYQLKQASQCRLNIPPTLVSNSPTEIRNFLKSYDSVIYKPFMTHSWQEQDGLKYSYTKKITLENLPSDPVLQRTPGIFQQQIAKHYELRITCFGNYMVAVKINSQMHPKGGTDWRLAPTRELQWELYTLPAAVEANIRNFMQRLGIVFGCFDFIVTPENEFYFLEVNEQGQFLWLDQVVPELRLLDVFVEFMLNKTIDFQWNPNANPVQFNDYEQEISSILYQLGLLTKELHILADVEQRFLLMWNTNSC